MNGFKENNLPESKISNKKNLLINANTLLLISFILAFILLVPAARADIISQNSGGDEDVQVTPNVFVEGYFPELGICGDGILEPANEEQCDDGNIVSSDGCSSTCQTEAVTPPGDGGGGGGGGGVPLAISLSPTELNVNLALDGRAERTIKVTNLGTSQITTTATQSGLGNVLVIPNATLVIPAGQSADLRVIFVSLDNQTGIFTGSIIIGGKTVLVVVNVRTKLLLFDSNIVILNENFEVEQGEELRTSVALIPLGDPERLDVTLNFIIKDYANRVYLTKTETLLIDDQVNLRRDFELGNIPIGDYVIGLELNYPNGVAPSSAHFKIIGKTPGVLGRIILYLVSLVLLIAIIIVVLLIRRRLKRKESETSSAEQ